MEPTPTTATAADVRSWAKENGHPVGVRGTLAADLVHAFERATGRTYTKAS